MNLFRSEEHARSWTGYDETMASMLKPVAEWARIFSGPIFRNRSRPDYITWLLSDEGRAGFAQLRAELAP
ncbi:MAG: hypothetical protein O3C27_03365 [Actinomycetota bacterium]|nr:hypothetical protein [Actinomycetota bacterium]